MNPSTCSVARFRDPNLKAFVERVRTVAAGKPSNAQMVEGVAQAAASLADTRLDLERELRFLPEGSYGRNLIHRDLEYGFVVIAMVWPPGLIGLPHDHGTWGVVYVAEGTVSITNYEREDEGTEPGFAQLRECQCLEAGPGAVATVLPPERDFHRVGNASSQDPAISIHIYGRDICRFHSVDLDSGSLTPADARYTNTATGPRL